MQAVNETGIEGKKKKKKRWKGGERRQEQRIGGMVMMDREEDEAGKSETGRHGGRRQVTAAAVRLTAEKERCAAVQAVKGRRKVLSQAGKAGSGQRSSAWERNEMSKSISCSAKACVPPAHPWKEVPIPSPPAPSPTTVLKCAVAVWQVCKCKVCSVRRSLPKEVEDGGVCVQAVCESEQGGVGQKERLPGIYREGCAMLWACLPGRETGRNAFIR